MSSTINAGTSGLVLTGSTTTTLSLATNGTTRATIDASGNVGIGTATPVQTLEVKSNNAFGQFTIDSAGGQYSQMFFKNNGTAVGSLFTDNSNNFLEVYGYSNVGIKFTTNNSERMRLDTSGNLGIGTSTPTAPLTIASVSGTAAAALIQGEVNNERFQIRSAVGSTGLAGGTAVVSIFGSRGTIASPSASLSGDQLGYYQLGGYDGTNWVRSAWITGLAAENYSATNRGSHLTFATTPIGSTAIAERMRIDSSGNVGIGGTADAQARVHVLGTLPSNGGNSQSFRATGTIPSASTGAGAGFVSFPSTQAAAFTVTRLDHFFAGFNSLGASSAITTQYGFHADNSLTQGTNNYGFYGNIPAGSNRWNFYAAGTAQNYFAGSTGVGNTPGSTIRFRVKGSDTTSSNYAIYVENSADGALFFIRNDGGFFTGLAAVSPYNNTTGNAANVYVANDGYLYRSTSSLRYKTNVVDAAHGLADVLKLRSVTYKGKNDSDTVFGGLIAEEVHDAGLTEFVAYDKEGRPDALHYGNMVALLVKAVQELSAKVAVLEGK